MKTRTRHLPQVTHIKANSIHQSLNRAIFSLAVLAFAVPYHVSASETTVEPTSQPVPAVSARPAVSPFTPAEAEDLNGADNHPSSRIIPPGYTDCDEISNSYAKAGCEATNFTTRPGTTVILDENLSPAQNREITKAMTTIFKMFGGADRFYEETGIPELTFTHVTQLTCKQKGAVACYIGRGEIEMTDGAFSPANLVPGWYTAHEVGHVYDLSRAKDDPKKYRSQVFVNHFVPDDPFSNLAGQPGCRVVPGSGCTGEGWAMNVVGTGGTSYGQKNSVEDFADAFAVTYASYVNHSVQPYNSFHDCWRIFTIWDMINEKI